MQYMPVAQYVCLDTCALVGLYGTWNDIGFFTEFTGQPIGPKFKQSIGLIEL
jgi:hypothetical protein